MIDPKRLARYLYVSDMAVCCEICDNNTWNSELSTEELFTKHNWHDAECPLRGKRQVYEAWTSDKEAELKSWQGKVKVKSIVVEGSRHHTSWLETDAGEELRLVPVFDGGLHNMDMLQLEGLDIAVGGCLVDSNTLYYSFLISRTKR